MRIGSGWDSHELVAGRPLVLGGVTIPFDRGLAGHSDGDALIHAVIDALLGAAALGDIGAHFPEGAPAWAGIASGKLLQKVKAMLDKEGYEIVNIDATVITRAPKLAPHIPGMIKALALLLDLPAGQISVKAKSANGQDAAGQGRAVEAQAVCLLE